MIAEEFPIGDMQGSASRNSSSDQLSLIRGHGSEDLGFFVNKGESRCHPLESPQEVKIARTGQKTSLLHEMNTLRSGRRSANKALRIEEVNTYVIVCPGTDAAYSSRHPGAA